MPRYARMVINDQKTVYHVMSRTALDGFPFGDIEKDELLATIKRFTSIYFVEILGFALLDNHFHIVCRVFPDKYFSDEDIKQRFEAFYGKDKFFPSEDISYYREKWSSLSEFVRDIKQNFSRYYNKMHGRRGTLWGERFKSVIVEEGHTLINLLAYVELNPLRAGIVERPEEYRWCSLGYHVQAKNKDSFLSTDFGLKEFGVLDEQERLRRYRRYVYEAGAIDRPEKMKSKVIDGKILEKERKQDYNLNRIQRFHYRTRYFTDSGIIGSKAFVRKNYQRFKDRFQSKHEKKPKHFKGQINHFSIF